MGHADDTLGSLPSAGFVGIDTRKLRLPSLEAVSSTSMPRTPWPKVSQVTLADQAHAAIRERILRGAMSPG
jgi:hypothetical protein